MPGCARVASAHMRGRRAAPRRKAAPGRPGPFPLRAILTILKPLFAGGCVYWPVRSSALFGRAGHGTSEEAGTGAMPDATVV